ncbi:hypothetical protein CHL79_25475 [Delftia acidovorans]|nr:hypothetical protein CHL79_25475 [Delftia acidovorans]
MLFLIKCLHAHHLNITGEIHNESQRHQALYDDEIRNRHYGIQRENIVRESLGEVGQCICVRIGCLGLAGFA